MKKHTLALCLAAILAPASYATEINVADLTWKAITFGQSTDMNFGSTILPEKVGVNQVTVNGQPIEEGKLLSQFTIESRGGKLANSHEGLTFYYTELPTDVNFTLSADVVLEQLGPETGATPNRQEGAGLMVRDILGAERLVPQPEGHEEFPSASNMVMNLLRSHSRTNDGMTNFNASFREGVYQPWGTAGNRLSRVDYAEGVPYGTAETFRMTLTRTNDGFKVSYRQGDKEQTQDVKGANANIVEMQNPESQYIGFFASRNAKMSVSNVDLQLSPADTIDAPKYQAKQEQLMFQLASADRSATQRYPVQARANYSGTVELKHNGKTVSSKKVNAGELFSQQVELNRDKNQFELTFTAIEGPTLDKQILRYEVTRVSLPNPLQLHVSPSGTASGNGSAAKPLDFATAVALLPAGGTIILQEGDYQGITIPVTASGTAEQMKYLKAAEGKVRIVSEFQHDANYWHYENIEVAGAQFFVHGSHNQFEKMVTHSAPDTGFVITSPEKIGRALWASYNTVIDSESFNNMDPSQINADGFAAKMRIGDGNTFIRCLSHHNIDDGWDLFNKVEDGANGAVTIIDSIAFNNGRTLDVANKGGTIGNGFKLGGEGIPVSHVVKNSLSFNNNMDGFTDNFNPGSLVLSNNVAIDNKRFNYLFRQSPYAGEIEQGTFTENRSYRFQVSSQYDDVIHSAHASDNQFIVDGRTLGSDGKAIDLKSLQPLKQASVIDEQQTVPGLKEALALKQLVQQ
ncbi:right-handed parallel beta-helix repeat-containing protein [Vibrio vulnificus]|uniref:right-handed parallel beta-helix repeat-containing protein n=1 Tax=Vibrio vulnificus TaxID=672 RepID=UPI000CD2B507|nr:exopolygalacturonate lyase [Vibrio vulnificus]EHD1696580.1 exopolygalacturonate lyase [Vibrio vulnificus]EHU4974415.1 exopolygalacturonate lyase [Vibrio vulnificus]MCA3925352.1 exopolygalacturonate lyase [Vibrio vulnificus]MCU8445028.1 exopolygalacturonate lyase [Vibrio vulnificus]POC40461.1 exopolygalacturonate lyase [Vibrio vulnificus]